jgi:hypothetical protein
MNLKLGLLHEGKNADMAFENRVLRKIFSLKREKVIGAWENYIMSSIIIY